MCKTKTECLLKELTIWHQMKHQNRVRLFDYIRDAKWTYICMEYVPDGDLDCLLSSEITLHKTITKNGFFKSLELCITSKWLECVTMMWGLEHPCLEKTWSCVISERLKHWTKDSFLRWWNVRLCSSWSHQGTTLRYEKGWCLVFWWFDHLFYNLNIQIFCCFRKR